MFSRQKIIAVTILVTAAFALRSMAAEPDAPKAFEDQIKYLEGALAESVRTRDLTMLDMAVKGFKASKLEGKDLELSILRAERAAAWNYSQQFAAPNSASLEAWGLMARAKMDNAEALASLRRLADELPPAPEPLPPIKQVKPAEYQAKQAAVNAYGARVRLRDHSIFVLALMKEPGIQDKAMAAIQNRKANTDDQVRMMGMYGGTDPLTLAVLEPDADAGFKRLVAFCQDEKNSLKDQVAMLGELNGLFGPTDFMGADEQFSVATAIRKRIPKEDRQLVVAPFVGILKRYVPDPKNGWDMTLNYINNISMALPANALTPEGVDAIEALVNKLPGPKEQYPKQSFIAILKKYGKGADAPVKPPKPPLDDKQF